MRRAGQTVRGRHRHEQSGQALLPSPRGRDPTDMAKSTSQRVSCFENSVKLSSQFTLSRKSNSFPTVWYLRLSKKRCHSLCCVQKELHTGVEGVFLRITFQ